MALALISPDGDQAHAPRGAEDQVGIPGLGSRSGQCDENVRRVLRRLIPTLPLDCWPHRSSAARCQALEGELPPVFASINCGEYVQHAKFRPKALPIYPATHLDKFVSKLFDTFVLLQNGKIGEVPHTLLYSINTI
jgi:hypothetical protein